MIHSNDHVYLSPHYDDASLSCGGAIHQQIQAGQPVLVITICAASPDPGEPLSLFAEVLHDAWGNPANLVATRRAEDQASMAILGVDYYYLDFIDCIYRRDPEQGTWHYCSNQDIFGDIHPADLPLAQRIAEVIGNIVPRNDETIIYAPLTVGHHVDHQLCHAAARQLQQQDWNVVFYEDYPYCDPGYPFTKLIREQHQYTLAATLAAAGARLRPQLRPLTTENFQAKIESIRAYASQINVLFGSEVPIEERVRAYALRVGQGDPAERIWLPM